MSAKLINYHGIELKVPRWTQYLAMDADTELYAFSIAPSARYTSWVCAESHRCVEIHYRLSGSPRNDLCPFWKQSLVYVGDQ